MVNFRLAFNMLKLPELFILPKLENKGITISFLVSAIRLPRNRGVPTENGTLCSSDQGKRVCLTVTNGVKVIRVEAVSCASVDQLKLVCLF